MFLAAGTTTNKPMAPYRAQILDHGGNVRYTANFMAEHDEHAMSHANMMWGGSCVGAGYEVWQDDRLVHSVKLRRPLRTRQS